MTRLVQIEASEHPAPGDASLLPRLEADVIPRHQPDAHWQAWNESGQVVARVSLWWTQTPPHPQHRLGVIGHFAAADEPAAVLLLNKACTELAACGCTLAVGPMDGNTWRHHRLLTERGDEPTFFLEPDNPDAWPGCFTRAGFAPMARYFSAVCADLAIEDPRIPRALERLERAGVRLRPLAADHLTEELRRIFAVSCASFTSNFLYLPIAEEEFVSQYASIRPHLRPELVTLAEQSGRPVGFVFGIPDLAQARRGVPVDTVVLKTVAVLPGREFAGLGNVLVARCHQAARELGFRRVIHALMHESNNSLNLSGHYAKPFRRYTLFARALSGGTDGPAPSLLAS